MLDKIKDDIPVTHFDCHPHELKNKRDAALWARACLDSLSIQFCRYWCVGCYVRDKNDKRSTKKWAQVQKDFHEALLYLPNIQSGTSECPSCMIVKAFSTFPLIAKYASNPPLKSSTIPTARPLDQEYSKLTNEELASTSTREPPSVPCCKYIYEYSIDWFSQIIDKRERQNVFLWLDEGFLPAMPPKIRLEVRKRFLAGTFIVQQLYRIIEPNGYGVLEIPELLQQRINEIRTGISNMEKNPEDLNFPAELSITNESDNQDSLKTSKSLPGVMKNKKEKGVDIRFDPTDEKILKFLIKQSKRLKTSEIACRLNLNEKSIGKNLSKLVIHGLLHNKPRIGYRITEKGRSLTP